MYLARRNVSDITQHSGIRVVCHFDVVVVVVVRCWALTAS
jgi:hypothetical protein